MVVLTTVGFLLEALLSRMGGERGGEELAFLLSSGSKINFKNWRKLKEAGNGKHTLGRGWGRGRGYIYNYGATFLQLCLIVRNILDGFPKFNKKEGGNEASFFPVSRSHFKFDVQSQQGGFELR